jgi:glycogen(starch) synthase
MADRPARRLRVLMLSWEYPPQVVGGLGRHVEGLSAALAAAGHEVTVLTRAAPGAAGAELTSAGVRVLRPLPSSSTDGLSAWTGAVTHPLARDAVKALHGGDYDLVHAHDWLLGHTAVTLARRLGVPLVATLHTTEAHRRQRRLPARVDAAVHAVERRLGHEARRVITCSRYMRGQVIEQLDLDPDRVTVVVDGVDPDRWRAAARDVLAERLRYAGAGPLIGYAGRLSAEKGVDDLIGALPRLRRRHPGLRLVVAGDGPARTDLRRLARQLRLERAVSFAGFLDQTRLRAVLAACDAVALPSIYEPAGMIALEVAATGVPLAAAGVGGLPEFVESGLTGLLFAPGDPDGLAEAVDRVLADPTVAGRMATAARARVCAAYRWSAVATRTAEVYAAAVGPRSTAAAGPALARA